jgi:cytochrome P450
MDQHLSQGPPIFDPFTPEFQSDPFPILRRLRTEDPVHRSRFGWVLTRYDDVVAALRNPSLGAAFDRQAGRAQLGDGAAFAYVSRRIHNFDPPDHTRLRSLVTKAFTVRRVEALRPHIQAIADALLDSIDGAKTIDVLAALAHPLPSLVICEMLGVPDSDRPQFSRWTEDIAFLLDPGVPSHRLAAGEAAAAEFMTYVRDLIGHRRTTPTDDLLNALIVAEEHGDRLSIDELIANVVFLFSAGHQTTRDLVGNGLLALLRNPQVKRQVAGDSSRLPALVEECLRYDPSVTATPRRAREDTMIARTRIAAGDRLILSISGANRDPARFPDPDRFDVDRPDNEPVTFGGGIHYCLGAALARTEAQIVFGTLLRRYPNLELAERTVQWRETWIFRGPVTLHVSL